MLTDALDKLKRNSILSSILLMALGVVILICPTERVDLLILVLGYALIVLALVMVLDFFASKKSLMDYIKFTGALILAIGGLCALLFRHEVILVLAWVFGILLILDGLRTTYNSVTFGRNSGRKAWWVLTILSLLLVGTGVVVIIHPGCDQPHLLLKLIGGAVLFSAAVALARLFFTWPIKKSKGDKNDGKEEN